MAGTGKKNIKHESRKLVLKIDSPGKVSVETLSKKLQAAQQVLFNIGSSIAGGGRRGPHSGEVVQNCTLFFVESKPGSLEVIAQLAEPSVLFGEYDIGEQALKHMGETLEAIQNKDRKAIEHLYRDSGQRTRVIKSVTRLLPEEDAEYDVLVLTSGFQNRLHSNLRETFEVVLVEPTELPELAMKTLTGTLYLIEVTTGQRQVGVTVNNRHIHCFYAAEDEAVIRDLIPGSLVEVKGRATLNESGDVQQIEEIMDITMVQPIVPLNWTRIDYGNRRFLLQEQIQIQQDFRDGVWVYEFEPLKVLGYGLSRHEALVTFRKDFAVCWDDIVQEEDANLTLDAQELKQKLKQLVKEVQSLA